MSGTATLGALLRDADAADAAAIAAIYAPQVLHGTSSYEEEPPDGAELARRMAEVAARGLPWLVAELDGRVAGYAYASPFRARAAYRHTVENSVYIADWAQGRGLGRLLLQALIDRCTALGHRRMVAVVGDAGNQASVRLHEALGFQRSGVLPGVGVKFGRELELLILWRGLG